MLFKVIDKHIPKIKIKSEYQPPWFDSETYNHCRKKERLRAKFKSTGNLDDYAKYSKCRSDLKKLVKQKMRDNFSDDCESAYITKKFWSYIKSSTNTSRIPETVYYENNEHPSYRSITKS